MKTGKQNENKKKTHKLPIRRRLMIYDFERRVVFVYNEERIEWKRSKRFGCTYVPRRGGRGEILCGGAFVSIIK